MNSEGRSNYSRLADFAVGRDNNFNLMRFLAASAVVVSHSVAITKGVDAFSPLRHIAGMDLGNIAVDVFFVTSGFLVTGSLLKRTLAEYVGARIARVYPGYVLAILFCVLVVGAYCTTLPFYEYLTHSQTRLFVFKNLSLLGGTSFNLPGVFESLPIRGVVNGSLWTLPWEARLYVVLLLFAIVSSIFSRVHSRALESLIFLFGIAVVAAQLANQELHLFPRDGLRVASMFFAGAMLYVGRRSVPLYPRSLALCVLGLLLAIFDQRLFHVVYTLVFPYVVLALAYLPGGRIRAFNHCGDYSYGIYIYSFPIQQSLVLTLGPLEPVAMLAFSFPLTLALAVPSWHLVEKRFLPRHKSASRQPEGGASVFDFAYSGASSKDGAE